MIENQMTTITQATYEKGLFRPTIILPLKEHSRVMLVVAPLRRWNKKKQLEGFLQKIHAQARKFSPEAIEADITAAARAAQKKLYH
ncbi:MAG: DUF104 domain-containing protein [Elusimicrobia bacterium]|nr:DUF104 domain-containing protein [Elusimicrobiota bacterium]